MARACAYSSHLGSPYLIGSWLASARESLAVAHVGATGRRAGRVSWSVQKVAGWVSWKVTVWPLEVTPEMLWVSSQRRRDVWPEMEPPGTPERFNRHHGRIYGSRTKAVGH
jgi:hypothetical protein